MKRGESGLSLVVAVNKPSGMSSHDVVNRCRRIFGERRVGHTGTLDPLATGVLPICIGPATRLGTFLTAHDKRYRVTMAFGNETTTDDVMGEPTVHGEVCADLLDGAFAEAYVAGLVGKRMQVPPQYSAIKQAGKKAYEVVRAGGEVNLQSRPIEVYEAQLVDRFKEGDRVCWSVDFSVSKGTYVRALVRDIGRELGARAHVRELARLQVGDITLHECVSLETLETLKSDAAIDPVRLLGYRFLFGDSKSKAVESGAKIEVDGLHVHEFVSGNDSLEQCVCPGQITPSETPLSDGELVSVILSNRLKGIYRFNGNARHLKPECIFAIGVYRG